MLEKWDILDVNGIPTGKTTLRGKSTLKNGEYHLVVHIWPVTTDGKILIQRRSDTKKLMPGEWAATGGAAISGENSITAATRELFEELGLKRNSFQMEKITRIKRRNSLLDIWFTICEFGSNDITLQKSEVAEVKWVNIGQLQKMVNDGLFHNYGKEYFEIIFDKIKQISAVTV